ncbi:fibropellin-1-like isoform X2 [Ruditapes philippinarum]|uniref:fibropellin-1-like isoform X2 n=1 Tax=Ruditapes philippinarum TaxID=129788 RepID=UPI00295AFE31|nr:fibropellin-1-like isoform X2 [Ruditapes philippinarum]
MKNILCYQLYMIYVSVLLFSNIPVEGSYIDECLRNPCQNGATCINEHGYTCTCAGGWQGTNCDIDIDECLSNPCQNGATCNNKQNGFTCTCAGGWQGTNCDIDIDECLSNPCQNGATCDNEQNCYTCTCAGGWQGTNCDIDIDECLSNPCQNGATCNNEQNGYTCRCAGGWQGTNCDIDIDECASNPCMNGGTCSNNQNQFTCACMAGWTGERCTTDIDECASNPCMNGGTCTNDQNRFTCTCAAGWTGENCNALRKEPPIPDIDECAARIDNCSSNARCDNTAGSFTCTCDWGYKGNGYSCVSQLEYLCNPDDSINVFNLPDDSYLFAMQVVTNGNDILCTVHEENATTVNLTGCSKNEEIIITYGPYSEIATYKLHGGKTVIVKFVCLEIAEQGVIHTVNSSYAAQLTIDQQISIDPSYSVTSQLSATSTTVGSEIIWTILFPENYNLEVSSCTAYPGIDDSSENYVNLISNGGCSVIADIISNFNSYSNGTATATFQAFKFYNYESVFLECSVKICPSGTACMTSCSRQKRGIQKRASGRQRSMVPATISNVLYVADAYSSGTLQCILDFPTTVIFTVIIAITRAARG